MTRRSDEVRWQRPAEAVVLLCRGWTARTALPIAAGVGTLLSAVNQGSVIVGGHASTATWLRVAVNYLVPFLVASAGWLAARRVPAANVLLPGDAPDTTAPQ